MTVQELRDLLMDLDGTETVTISVHPPAPPLTFSSGQRMPSIDEVEKNLYGHEIPVIAYSIHLGTTGIPMHDEHKGICLQTWMNNMQGPVLGTIIYGEPLSHDRA